MNEQEIRAKAKEIWKKIAMEFSDAPGLFGLDGMKKKLKQLNRIIDEMPLQEVIDEMQENEAFIASF